MIHAVKFITALTALLILFALPHPASAQAQDTILYDESEGMDLTIPKIDPETNKATNLHANELNTSISTIKVGMGLIWDFTTYVQDDVFKQQVDSANVGIVPRGKLRDFRVLGSG